MVKILHFGEVHIGKNARNCRNVAAAYLPVSRRHADVYAKKGHRRSDDPSPWRPYGKKRDSLKGRPGFRSHRLSEAYATDPRLREHRPDPDIRSIQEHIRERPTMLFQTAHFYTACVKRYAHNLYPASTTLSRLVPPVGVEPTSRGIQVLYPFTHRSSAFELWRHIRGGYKTTNSIYSCTLARLRRLRGIGL